MKSQERSEDHEDSTKAAIKNNIEEYYLTLGKKLGHVNLKPTDTSELSLNRLLKGEGEEAQTTLDDAMAVTWVDGGVECTYFHPKHTKNQRAAEVRLSLHKKEGTVLWQSRLLDISFAGLKPGVSASDFFAQLKLVGSRYDRIERWGSLPSGWTVFWKLSNERVQPAFDLEPLADVGEHIDELRFSNPEYTTRRRGDPLLLRPQ
jgi:hypothetical protein